MTNLTATDKIQKIAEHIRDNVLDPAEEERKEILKEAKEEKERIIAEAKKEAEGIIETAAAQSRELNAGTETALRLAAKQAITVLKLSLEKEVIKQTIEEPVKKVLNEPDILKHIIMEIAKAYVEKNFSGEVEVLVSKGNRAKLKKYIKAETANIIKGGLSLSEETGISGCKIIFKDNRIVIEFSAEAITELLAKYVRPEIRTYLFE